MIKRILLLLALLCAPLGSAHAQFTDQRTWGGAATGSANAIVATIPNLTAHLPGVTLRFKATAANTGATTYNPGPGAVALRKSTRSGVVALSGNEIQNGDVVAVVYDGTFYQLLSSQSPGGTQAKTSAYSVTAADCWTVISLGGSGFYGLTAPAASGFPDGCEIKLINASTTRGRAMVVAGITIYTLYYGQTSIIYNNNGTWQRNPKFELLAGDPIFYVNAISGSDNPAISDGLASGAGAFATFQHAVDVIRTQIYTNGGATVQADCEASYDQHVTVTGLAANSHIIRFVGNPGSPVSCLWTSSTAARIFDVEDYGVAVITGFQFGFSGSGTAGAIYARQFAIVDIDAVNFSSNTGGSHILAEDLASVNVNNIGLRGNAATIAEAHGKAVITATGTWTVNGAINFSYLFTISDATVRMSSGSVVWSVTGSIGGFQYSCAFNSVLYSTNTLSSSWPAGTTAGIATSGCQVSP